MNTQLNICSYSTTTRVVRYPALHISVHCSRSIASTKNRQTNFGITPATRPLLVDLRSLTSYPCCSFMCVHHATEVGIPPKAHTISALRARYLRATAHRSVRKRLQTCPSDKVEHCVHAVRVQQVRSLARYDEHEECAASCAPSTTSGRAGVAVKWLSSFRFIHRVLPGPRPRPHSCTTACVCNRAIQ